MMLETPQVLTPLSGLLAKRGQQASAVSHVGKEDSAMKRFSTQARGQPSPEVGPGVASEREKPGGRVWAHRNSDEAEGGDYPIEGWRAPFDPNSRRSFSKICREEAAGNVDGGRAFEPGGTVAKAALAHIIWPSPDRAQGCEDTELRKAEPHDDPRGKRAPRLGNGIWDCGAAGKRLKLAGPRRQRLAVLFHPGSPALSDTL
ncbi:hypothetical protein AAFF_G00434120 [Aldrovandia affinis]|uniref:Uncharacterized protein n=1 Tax=Aldrovandia affinis TaxID=143900 RepID=A0AAD7WI67_9TELE|nr:hypothetical protein AAFF_G00434120 [Aldrovandia affinis]